MISFVLDTTEAERAIDEAIFYVESGDALREAEPEVTKLLTTELLKSFDNETAPDGSPWPDIRKVTIRMRRWKGFSGSKSGVESDKLRRSVAGKGPYFKLVWGNSFLIYRLIGKIAHWFERKFTTDANSAIPGRTHPAREYWHLILGLAQRIGDLLAAKYGEGITRKINRDL